MRNASPVPTGWKFPVLGTQYTGPVVHEGSPEWRKTVRYAFDKIPEVAVTAPNGGTATGQLTQVMQAALDKARARRCAMWGEGRMRSVFG